MPANRFVSRDEIRAAFSAAMSAMYRTEVPAYGTLIALVAEVNAEALARDPALRASLEATETIADREGHKRRSRL